MDRTRQRKLAAAIAAVIAHLAAETPQAATPAEAPPPAQPPPGHSPWALTGRHDTMLLRSLWQRRLSRTW